MGFKVVKRDGLLVDFDSNKIVEAISKAGREVGEDEEVLKQISKYISREIEKIAEQKRKTIKIEEIQDLVVKILKDTGFDNISKAYQEYRERRTAVREANSNLLKSVRGIIDGSNDEVLKENTNKKGKEINVQRDLIADVVNKTMARKMIPEDIMEAHDKGLIHLHDLGYYCHPGMVNCCLVNLKDCFENGTTLNDVKIETPKSIGVAMTQAAQMALSISSLSYGGQSHSLAHFCPYVRASKNKLIKRFRELNLGLDEGNFNKLVQAELEKEVRDAVQTYHYNLSSMVGSNGQSPFCSLIMDAGEARQEGYEEEFNMLAKEFFEQRIKGFKNKDGYRINIIFPKMLYFLDEDNIREGTKNFWLTKLACKCSAKCLSPDFISTKVQLKEEGFVRGSMGCRSFIGATYDEDGKLDIYGSRNLGVATLSLPYVALLSKEQNRDFFEVLDESLELCKKACMLRWDKLKGIKASCCILWQNGVYARLNPEDDLQEYLLKGKTSISLGYAGLYECCKVVTGESHTRKIGREFGLMVMQSLKQACDDWKNETGLPFSLYSTPIESTTDKFSNKLKERFGVIKDVTDKGYITNSYHVAVTEEINAFDKLFKESEFAKYSTGGRISYVEIGDMSKNIEGVIDIVQYGYEHCSYFEINFEADHCNACNSDATCIMDMESENLDWVCPVCGNRDPDKLIVLRRVCGYIGNIANSCRGRKLDVINRAKHL